MKKDLHDVNWQPEMNDPDLEAQYNKLLLKCRGVPEKYVPEKKVLGIKEKYTEGSEDVDA